MEKEHKLIHKKVPGLTRKVLCNCPEIIFDDV